MCYFIRFALSLASCVRLFVTDLVSTVIAPNVCLYHVSFVRFLRIFGGEQRKKTKRCDVLLNSLYNSLSPAFDF